MKPTNKLEKDLYFDCGKYNIEIDVNKLWENRVEHHPKSEKLAREIGAIDWLYLDDYFDFKFGGDGDNGEFLMYILDVLFRLEDAKGEENES